MYEWMIYDGDAFVGVITVDDVQSGFSWQILDHFKLMTLEELIKTAESPINEE